METRRTLLIVLTILLLVLGYLNLKSPFLVERLRSAGFDLMQVLAPAQQGSDLVRIVQIDEPSLQERGPWPWPGTRMAELLDALREDGAAVAVIAILLRHPDPRSPDALAAQLDNQLLAPEARDLLSNLPDPDAVFADRMRMMPTVGALLVGGSTGAFAGTAWGPVLFQPRLPGNQRLPFSEHGIGALPVFEEAFAGYGAINALPDTDGVVRRMPLIIRYHGHFVPSLSLEAIRVAQGLRGYRVRTTPEAQAGGSGPGIEALQVGDVVIPTDANGRMLLHFPEEAVHPSISAADVLAGRVEPGVFNGRIVVIGTDIVGLSKVNITPTGDKISGNMLIAHQISQILNQSFLERPDWLAGAETVIGFVAGILLAFLLPVLGPVRGALVGLGCVAAAIGVAVFAFRSDGLLVDPLFLVLAIVLVYSGTTFTSYLRSEQEVAARKKAEEALRHSEATALLARAEAEEANTAKTHFLAGVSHEIRSPLNAIIGFSEIIKEQALGEVQPKKYAEYGGDIHSSAEHLLNLINDLLDISKIEAGRMDLYFEPVDLAASVRAARLIVDTRADAKMITVEHQFAEDVPPVLADERAIRQIAINLLTNAINYTNQGGQVVARVSGDKETGVVFSVSDTGIGIAAEDMPRILEPFGRSRDLLVRDNVGTGLGIPLVSSLVKLHEAEFDIESEVGVGTTVLVRFPPDRVILLGQG